MWKRKKKWFNSLDDLTIVTPSQWLAGLVEQSFLGKYPVKVIHNGIDLSVFRQMESDFRKKHNLERKKLLLGVAFAWEERKGLDVFVELSRRLDSSYQIVLVGTNEDVDRLLPSNIVSIHRTHNQKELAEIYSVADVFVNPTREDTFPTVNLEALACGTPVITFKTGGSPECVDGHCGCVVPCNDVDALEREIVRICTEKPFTAEDCKARAALFDRDECFSRYVALYRG
jgi:glycosyltransferase involved in cell wall biosynthesis